MKLKDSDVNHLRRLLGYVRCEIGQSPEELKATLRKVTPVCGRPEEAAQARLVETYQKTASVPHYVRAAVKALEKLLADVETVEAVRFPFLVIEDSDMPLDQIEARSSNGQIVRVVNIK